MWCANGCATFSEIQKALRQVVKSDEGFSKVLETRRIGGKLFLPLSSKSDSDLMAYEEARKNVLAECVTEFFSNCQSLSVFSPSSGTCLRIDARVAAFREIPNLGWQYMFIDARTGTISGEQLNRCLSAASQSLALAREGIEEIDRDEATYLAYTKLCAMAYPSKAGSSTC